MTSQREEPCQGIGRVDVVVDNKDAELPFAGVRRLF